MEYRNLHAWNVTPSEAIQIQKSLASQIREEPLSDNIRYVAGADISFEKFSDIVYAAFVVIDINSLDVVAHSSVVTEAKFPYIPGLFSFRESPPLLQAWKQLTVEPDVVMFDGQGIAHPRRFGIASHMGLIIDRPSIGCAKTILVGKHGAVEEEAGSRTALIDRGEVVGAVVRTKRKVNPVFISVGHRVTLDEATVLALKVTKGYRIPEPTRQAHLLVNKLRLKERA
ncbi:MAG: deoxyribonuclease V [Blastocatellia bacterium]|nr:deoxyribonuclease V [Blastocatellia bacterium]